MIGRYRTGKIILKFLTEMCLFALVDKIHPSKIHLSKFLNIPFLNFHGNSKKAAISKGFFLFCTLSKITLVITIQVDNY